MSRMRGRDARAIAFCVVTTFLLLAAAYVLSRNYIASVALGGAWVAFLLTRPRMRRVVRRLRGDVDWSGYYDDGG